MVDWRVIMFEWLLLAAAWVCRWVHPDTAKRIREAVRLRRLDQGREILWRELMTPEQWLEMLWYFVLLLVGVATLIWMLWEDPLQDGRISGPYIITKEQRLYNEQFQKMSEDERWRRK